MKIIFELDQDELSAALNAGAIKHLSESVKGLIVETTATVTDKPKAKATKAAAKEAKAAEEATPDPAPTEQTPAEEPAGTEAPPWKTDAAEAPESPQSDESDSGHTYTLEEVRAKLAGLTKTGKRNEVRTLLEEFGAAKLPEVKEEDYAALMAKAVKL